jgi:hypothetical protein
VASAVDVTHIADLIRSNLFDADLALWHEVERKTASLLGKAINNGEPQIANQLWYLHKIALIRFQYIDAFCKVNRGKFYEAWCDFEQIEIGLKALAKNPLYDLPCFRVDDERRRIENWQSLYPYKCFFSPAFIIKREECSICGRPIDLVNYCGHEKGRVYGGRECYRLIKEAEFVEISLVSHPVQKYSVPFIHENGQQVDQYDYSMVKFVADRLGSPLDDWHAEWTEAYHPHSLFSDYPCEEECPCASGRRYIDCCLTKAGVVRPHLQIAFEKTPSMTLPNAALVGYGDQNGSLKVTLLEPAADCGGIQDSDHERGS